MGLRVGTAALLQLEDKPDRCPAALGKRLGPEGFGDRDLCLPPKEQLGIGEPTGL